MLLVETWIREKRDSGVSIKMIADIMDVQLSMPHKYLQVHRLPSMAVAKNVYLSDKVVLHPYSEESIVFEIANYS